MIKRALAVILCCASIGALTGCGCEHEWVAATCETPKTCSKCNETEGVALGHTPGDWQITEAAAINNPGTREKHCTVCGEIIASETYEYEMPLSELTTLVETVISENYPHYTIAFDESTSTITLKVWFDGLAAELALIQASGGDSNNGDWVTAKNGTISMANSIDGVLKAANRSDVHFAINVLNDMDTSKTLLSILDGTIIYDCLA